MAYCENFSLGSFVFSLLAVIRISLTSKISQDSKSGEMQVTLAITREK